MIDFPRSTFTWKSHPWKPDPHYRWTGGFVGTPGQVYHVRFNLETRCEVRDETSGQTAELFLGAPCRSEYTIARRNLFQIPSNEFRFVFSRNSRLNIASRPSDEAEEAPTARLDDLFQEHRIDVRAFPETTELTDAGQIAEATLANAVLSAVSTYRDAERGFTVAVEYPVNLININPVDGEFQVCTGPVILPDLATWDGREVGRVFLAHVAFSQFDHVEFILCREVQVAPEEREWLDKPRGRDRLELIDPSDPPPDYPPARPRPTVYNETWELPASNVILKAENT
jgi:hypothetical protein